MNAEEDFHRRRKAFVLLKEAGILLAQDGFSGSHFDLLRQAGFVESQARGIIETQPRGHALGGDVYFYQGVDFSPLSSENRETARQWLPFFRQNGMLTGRAFDGMRRGDAGQPWQPVADL